jgi:FixJ family two-component response regulator
METPRETVVVVDDDPVMRQALDGLLSVLGYRTELYASAAEFLAAAATTEAACLMLDIQLGDASGIDLARKLTASGFNFPIIFITGSDAENFRRDAMDLGCIAYLLKPFRVEQLTSAISRATGSNAHITPPKS